MMTHVSLVLALLLMTPILSDCKPPRCEKLVSLEDEHLDVFEIIAKANANISKFLIHGDIMPSLKRNADPCTESKCRWPRSGAYVYVPIKISSDFTTKECNVIIRAMMRFHQSTCIRFVWRTDEEAFIHFVSKNGCWSYVGRQGKEQQVSLQKSGCVYISTVQHEIMHALGFHHEQVRSDRDDYVDIHLENIEPGLEFAFRKGQTNNLGTPYDYNSVMQYHNYAFSKNGQPTITAKGNPDLPIGCATQLSLNDIARVNRLYQC